jgi:superfamily II DNA or RNA helicase
LTTLQRRLASSLEAIYQSLKRRRERLENRLREERLLKRGTEARLEAPSDVPEMTTEDIEELEDAPDAEIEAAEEKVVDQATAARSIAELEAEIAELKRLETLALKVRRSGTDRKWDELRHLLENNPEIVDPEGNCRKIVIFSEHRDTLNYLVERIRALLRQPEAVVQIHGAMGREDRRKAQEGFTQDKKVQILVATDAAGEGINLQRAHLAVNYDLPWNPNRLEQRFGRIHRIGQSEVCHLWNLVAEETREGEVFTRILEKLEEERAALGGQVFDVIGKLLFDNRPLRDLMIEAIRYGERPDVRERLTRIVDEALDRSHIRELIEERALSHDSIDATRVREIREEMERAEARRLQPHFISSFFLEAFSLLGGTIREREPKRYEITHVPAAVRNRDRLIGRGDPMLPRYERVTFEKDLIAVQGKPLAEFVCPGHPLLDATIDLILERYRELLKRGTLLIAPSETRVESVRGLCYLEHSIQDARTDRSGNRRVVSRRMQFVEIDEHGEAHNAGYAPYLDYRPASDEERELVRPTLEADWLSKDVEREAIQYAVSNLVPDHLAEIKSRKEALIAKTEAAVRDRLTKEINYWDLRAEELKAQELAGKTPLLNSGRARQRADELQARLEKRLAELQHERQLSAMPPVVIGGALVVPEAMVAALSGATATFVDAIAHDSVRVESLAMTAVMEAEQRLGFHPRDVSKDNCGYDIESRVPGKGQLRFIEVKGRAAGADTVTVTRNEILTALNKPDDFILAIVEVNGESVTPRYVRRPFQKEPDFAAASVNYKTRELLSGSSDPE